ncbi:MAG: zinc ribbon domain-containing protein [Anaerolineae bacterium]|nr:zinc ribbon domain-containing protein [Anaerolineae bacterium]
MPIYDFRCNVCHRKIILRYKTYEDYDNATHTCPHCQSTDVTRLISRVAVKKSLTSRLFSGGYGGDDDAALSDLDHADPRTLGRVLREMNAEVGEDMGGEFDEIVGRLESGERPEEIEASMPDLPDNPLTSGGLDTSADD